MFNPFPPRTSRIGFHYYPDTLHYRESDIQTWLGELKALGASWLVLQAASERAIPEFFLKALIQNGIEPLLQFDLNPASPPAPSELAAIFEAYARWGVHGVILFERPNSRQAWPSAGWGQQGLVERFLDNTLPLTQLAIQAGLSPLFTTLEPGGSYWDIAFLKAALESLERRKQTNVLENLLLTAYGWTHDHLLDWGAGGPQRWQAAKPYFTPSGVEDQRGFNIFEWYEAIAAQVTGNSVPVLVLQAGVKADPQKQMPMDAAGSEELTGQIAHWLAGKTVQIESAKTLQPPPDYLLGVNFWLLAAEKTNRFANQALFQDTGAYDKTIIGLKALTEKLRTEQGGVLKAFDPNHPIDHYLLIPTYEWGVADWHLDVIRPFIKRYKPVVGFSLQEARLAREVTVIANSHAIADEQLDQLRHYGCKVRRISGDGTSIATQLSER